MARSQADHTHGAEQDKHQPGKHPRPLTPAKGRSLGVRPTLWLGYGGRSGVGEDDVRLEVVGHELDLLGGGLSQGRVLRVLRVIQQSGKKPTPVKMKVMGLLQELLEGDHLSAMFIMEPPDGAKSRIVIVGLAGP